MGAATASLITGGAGLLGQGINAISAGIQNKKMRRFTENMYNKQRADALADWNMMNEYNSPAQQMARLKEAGLNPMLVYGHGADGNASQMPRQAQQQSYNPQPIQFDLGSVAQSAIRDYYDIQMKKQQTDNLKAQNTVIMTDAMLKFAQTIATWIGGRKTQAEIPKINQETKNLGIQGNIANVNLDKANLDLNLSKSLFSTTVAQAMATLNKTNEEINKTKADIAFTNNQDTRAEKLNNMTISKMVQERLLIMKQQAKTEAEIRQIDAMIEKAKADTRLTNADAVLREAGIQPGDKLYTRTVLKVIQELKDGITNPSRKPAKEAGGRYSPIGRWINR